MKNYFKKFSIMFVMLLAVIGIGVIQNGSIANAATTVGQQLTAPETGWTRYDDSDINITFTAPKANSTQSYFVGEKSLSYNGTITSSIYSSNNLNSSISFNFYGTKLRVISPYWWSDTPSVDVYIDNILVGNFSEQRSNYGYQDLVYE